MRLIVNGAACDAEADTLADLLDLLGYAGACVATALNGDFAPAARRGEIGLAEGDEVEIVAPRQGG
jgi:sulfur carrier protein